jgi:threonine/homoserine/homoserine lactone efflux protein
MLLGFLLEYAAILAVPGPNMVAIGSLATLRGLRGATPLCVGMAAGAGTLNAVLPLCTSATGLGPFAPGAVLASAGRLAGAILLLGVGLCVLRPPAMARNDTRAGPGPAGAASDLTSLGAGFCTAFTNPLTAAFFAAQSIESPGGTFDTAAALAVLLVALGFYFGIAALLSHPAARRMALRWHWPVRLLASGVLILAATARLLDG